MSQTEFNSTLDDFISAHLLPNDYGEIAHSWFIPIFKKLLTHKNSAPETLFVGVNGSQGSGKSTLCSLLCELVNEHSDYRAITISLDDFYLSSQDRQKLAQTEHGLFATRGVPGTHDTQNMNAVFESLKRGEACSIPQFDKATDNPKVESDWLNITEKVDIVFFEGWCWGVTAQSEADLLSPFNTLESQKDAFGLWRSKVNDSLRLEYEPLYRFFDTWIMLKAPSFDCVYKWRCEQEAKLKLKNPAGSGLMSDQQILYFIQHYERLTTHCLSTLPASCDIVLSLDENRQIEESTL